MSNQELCYNGALACGKDEYCDEVVDECTSCSGLCSHPLITKSKIQLKQCLEKCPDFLLRILREGGVRPNFGIPQEWFWTVAGIAILLFILLVISLSAKRPSFRKVGHYAKYSYLCWSRDDRETRVPLKTQCDSDANSSKAAKNDENPMSDGNTYSQPTDDQCCAVGVRCERNMINPTACPVDERNADRDNLRPDQLLNEDREARQNSN